VSRESGQVYWIKDLNAGFITKKKRRGTFGLITKTIPKPVWTGPILVNGKLVMGGSTGQIIQVNAKTGDIERRVEVGAPGLIAPTVAGGTIYAVADNAQLIALR